MEQSLARMRLVINLLEVGLFNNLLLVSLNFKCIHSCGPYLVAIGTGAGGEDCGPQNRHDVTRRDASLLVLNVCNQTQPARSRYSTALTVAKCMTVESFWVVIC